MTDRDTTTRTRARAPGVGGVFHRRAVHDRVLRPDSERTTVATTKCTKSGCKLDGGRRMPEPGLSRQSPRKAPLGQSAFQPYWGKLALRNDRGDRGNVGIIRSPVRATILPDLDRRRPRRLLIEVLRSRHSPLVAANCLSIQDRPRRRSSIACLGVRLEKRCRYCGHHLAAAFDPKRAFVHV